MLNLIGKFFKPVALRHLINLKSQKHYPFIHSLSEKNAAKLFTVYDIKSQAVFDARKYGEDAKCTLAESSEITNLRTQAWPFSPCPELYLKVKKLTDNKLKVVRNKYLPQASIKLKNNSEGSLTKILEALKLNQQDATKQILDSRQKPPIFNTDLDNFYSLRKIKSAQEKLADDILNVQQEIITFVSFMEESYNKIKNLPKVFGDHQDISD